LDAVDALKRQRQSDVRVTLRMATSGWAA
jgi:hypothetical protein